MSLPVDLPPVAARLLRAARLAVVEFEAGVWCVTGGRGPHLVTEAGCDCLDHGMRGRTCKHILAVALARCAPDLREAVKELANMATEEVEA